MSHSDTDPQIRPGTGIMLVNPFTCPPGQESALLDLLAEATENLVKHLPGFISASFAKGLEPGHVVNVAMWASEEHYTNFLTNHDARLYFGRILQIATTTDPHLYQLAHHHTPAKANQ